MKRFFNLLLFILFICLATSAFNQTSQLEIYKNKNQSVENRVEDLLKRMTLEEKIDQITGNDFKSKANVRLGIPEMVMTDGPLGPRGRGKGSNYSSCMNIAATWDLDLMERIGKSIGEETRVLGYNLLLGPCIHISRVPYGGRNYESFGEDPYLTARMGVNFIKAVQSKRVITCVKHFACNNQEWNRFDVDARVSERALREIYFPAFKAAVQEADVWTIMGAYNKLNGHYCCANKYLLTDVLKIDWGFTGAAISDWGALRETLKPAKAGTDLEMPNGKYMGPDLLRAIKQGQIDETVIDDKVRRLLRVMFKAGLFDESVNDYGGFSNTEYRQKLALETAQKSIVLLKNEMDFLPLKKEKLNSIAVLGPNAAFARLGGDGSGFLDAHYTISPLDGIRNKVGDKVKIRYELGVKLKRKELPIAVAKMYRQSDGKTPGLKAEYFNNRNLEGDVVHTEIVDCINFNWESKSPVPGKVVKDKFSIRWTGKFVSPGKGIFEIGVKADNGVKLYLDGNLIINAWTDQAPGQFKTEYFEFDEGKLYDLKVEFYENIGTCRARLGIAPVKKGNELMDAVELAKKSDVVIICAGLAKNLEGEQRDRDYLELPPMQIDLINAVTKVNKNIIVVLNNSSAILMNEWINEVPAIVEAFYPGQEGGNALADILFGDINPSGKLPVTFMKKWEDHHAFETYPGKKEYAEYSDEIYVGYRHYDKNNVEPLFPFGYGLPYTTFEYSDLKLSSKTMAQDDEIEVSLKVKNSGKIDGDEVVQLYIHDVKASIDREVKALKGFQRVSLKAGESKTIEMKIDKSALAFYDIQSKSWVAEPGKFEVLIGSSSRDIRLQDDFKLKR